MHFIKEIHLLIERIRVRMRVAAVEKKKRQSLLARGVLKNGRGCLRRGIGAARRRPMPLLTAQVENPEVVVACVGSREAAEHEELAFDYQT